jgi:hypothetical protein
VSDVAIEKQEALLWRLSYREFLEEYMGVKDPQVFAVLQGLTTDSCTSIERAPALGLMTYVDLSPVLVGQCDRGSTSCRAPAEPGITAANPARPGCDELRVEARRACLVGWPRSSATPSPRDVDDLPDLAQIAVGDLRSVLGRGRFGVHVGDAPPRQRNPPGDAGLEQLDLVGERVGFDPRQDTCQSAGLEGLEGAIRVRDRARELGEPVLPDPNEEVASRVSRRTDQRHRVGLAA